MVGTAITYRMNAGFPGDVNRTHPASILPALNDGTSPVLTAGLVAMFNGAANDVRSVAVGDEQNPGTTVLHPAGIAVRSYPIQQPTAATFGAPATIGAPEPLPAAQPIDLLTSGLISVVVNGAVTKGATIFVWAAASTGNHVQGGFEAASSNGNTFALAAGNYFNGPADASGNVEIFIAAL